MEETRACCNPPASAADPGVPPALVSYPCKEMGSACFGNLPDLSFPLPAPWRAQSNCRPEEEYLYSQAQIRLTPPAHPSPPDL